MKYSESWNKTLKKVSKYLWKLQTLRRFAITTSLIDMKGFSAFFLRIYKIICVLTEISLYFTFYVVGRVYSH